MDSIFQKDYDEMERDAMFRKSAWNSDCRGPTKSSHDADLASLTAELTHSSDGTRSPSCAIPAPSAPIAMLPPTCLSMSPAVVTARSPSTVASAVGAYPFLGEERNSIREVRTTPELVGDLDELCNAWHIARGGKLPYEEIRDAACAINFELNRRGELAPRFRPQRKIRPAKEGAYASADRVLLNDLQVIDLHWLRCRGVKLRSENSKWQRLAAPAPFDFQLAEEFAATAGSPHLKVTEIIQFRQIHRLELAALQDRNLGKRWRVIQNGRDDAGGTAHGMRSVRERLENVPSMLRRGEAFIEGRVLLWACDRLVGIGKGSGPILAQLYAVAIGQKPDDPSNLRRALTTIETHLK